VTAAGDERSNRFNGFWRRGKPLETVKEVKEMGASVIPGLKPRC
jgi:hypothetical protein